MEEVYVICEHLSIFQHIQSNHKKRTAITFYAMCLKTIIVICMANIMWMVKAHYCQNILSLIALIIMICFGITSIRALNLVTESLRILD